MSCCSPCVHSPRACRLQHIGERLTLSTPRAFVPTSAQLDTCCYAGSFCRAQEGQAKATEDDMQAEFRRQEQAEAAVRSQSLLKIQKAVSMTKATAEHEKAMRAQQKALLQAKNQIDLDKLDAELDALAEVPRTMPAHFNHAPR
eukprot:COSAG01_NODE_5110_length_4475_cov_3.906764_4_plen_144_part_00